MSVSIESTFSARPEPVSPFMVWSAEDLRPVEDPSVHGDDPGLLVDLLRDPERMAERILEPQRLQPALLGALSVIVGSMMLFATVVGPAAGLELQELLRAAALLPLNMLLATIAAFGPAYAASILVAARMPLARLVAGICCSLAVGAVILAALSPLPHVLMKLDPLWAGPLSLVACFAVSALLTGIRVRRILTSMATLVHRASLDCSAAELPEEVAHRVGIFARVAMVFLAFTVSLSFWAFDVLF